MVNSRYKKTITFKQYKKALFSCVHNHIEKYGGDFNEVYADACVHFVECLDKWDEKRSSIHTWIRYYVSQELHNSWVLDRKKKSYHSKYLGSLTGTSGFDLREFLHDLSEDARTVVMLVVEPPADITLAIQTARGEGFPSEYRRAIPEYLREIGWVTSRIYSVFDEIRSALT